MAYAAPAGVARHPTPQAAVTRRGDTVTLDLATQGDGISLLVPAKAKLRAATIGEVTTPASGEGVSITCSTPDCTKARIILKLDSSQPFDLSLIAYTRGLPPEGDKLLKARPAWAMPSQGGDRSLFATKIAIPAS